MVAACDEACENSCWGAEAEGCDNCKEGWTLTEDNGCDGKTCLTIILKT